jgi:SAM-dependent methyltransferase
VVVAAPRAPWWVPARRRGHEYLDDPTCDPLVAARSLRDIALANRLFGGTRAVLRALDAVWPALAPSASLLDVGTGLGDIPHAARAGAARHGVALHTVGLEMNAALARGARERAIVTLAADARRLPFADGAFDVVTCSQVLHHFDGADAAALLAECTRVARRAVIVSDLRRSWPAAALLWLVSFPLGFHAVSRHDGVVSVLRGFTPGELADTVRAATGHAPRVATRLGWRLTATWPAG